MVLKYAATTDEGAAASEGQRMFKGQAASAWTTHVHMYKAMVGPGSDYFPLSFCGIKVGFFSETQQYLFDIHRH